MIVKQMFEINIDTEHLFVYNLYRTHVLKQVIGS